MNWNGLRVGEIAGDSGKLRVYTFKWLHFGHCGHSLKQMVLKWKAIILSTLPRQRKNITTLVVCFPGEENTTVRWHFRHHDYDDESNDIPVLQLERCTFFCCMESRERTNYSRAMIEFVTALTRATGLGWLTPLHVVSTSGDESAIEQCKQREKNRIKLGVGKSGVKMQLLLFMQIKSATCNAISNFCGCVFFFFVLLGTCDDVVANWLWLLLIRWKVD